jgi:hypothetical protein
MGSTRIKEMKLHETIEALEQGLLAVEYGQISKYKKSILTYFSRLFTSTPMLIPVAVSNAAQYCLIAPVGEVYDAIIAYDENAAGDEELMETYLQYIQPL